MPFFLLNNSELKSLFQKTPNQNILNSSSIDPTKIQHNNFPSDSLSFLNLNIRSLNKNLSKLEILLNQLNFSPTIIFVSETWLNHKKPFLFSLQGYNFIDRPCVEKNGGGVGIFIKNNLQYNILSNFNLNVQGCEDIWLELSTSANKKITVSCIYRHPSYNLQPFQERFSNILETLNNKNTTYVIGGDFNINYFSNNQNMLNYINEIKS